MISKGNCTIEKASLAEKLGLISEYWEPSIVGELNGQHVKLAKIQGEFVWHTHEQEDELFLILDGTLRMELKDRDPVILNKGEFLIMPLGTEHRTVAEREVAVMLFEPVGTSKTGDAV